MAEAIGRPLAFPISKVSPLATTDIVQLKVTGDSQNRFVLNGDGSMQWGDGASALDTQLERLSANPGNLMLTGDNANQAVLVINNAAGTVRDVRFASGGVNRWMFRCTATAESGANAGSDVQLISRSDAGALIRTDLNMTRSTGLWAIGGTIQPATDNASDLGASDTNRWRSLYLGSPAITKGSGTGVTLNNSGEVRKMTYKVTVTFAALAAAATTADKTIATLPAKTRVLAIYADTTTKYIGGAVATCTIAVGTAAGGAQLLAAHDVFTAAVTKGLADADMGTAMTRAAAIQGGHMPSFTATTIVNVRLTTTGANTNALTQGSTTYYIECEVLP